MPRLDLILLPLLAGYILLSKFNLTKYYNQRVDTQRLIFNSLICTLLLAAIAYLSDYIILRSTFRIWPLPPFVELRSDISGLIDDIVGKQHIVYGLKHSILILLLAYPLGAFLNLFFKKRYAFRYAIEKWGNQLERMFWLSLIEPNEADRILMLTTKSNKVYIGYVNKLSAPLGESYIRIIPSLSGYRNKDDLRIDITTKYTEIIAEYINTGRKAEIDKKLGIILPVSEILSVSKFDPEIFGWFNDLKEETSTEEIHWPRKVIQIFTSLFRNE